MSLQKLRLQSTNSQGETRTAVTNPFGYYHFMEVAAGETYIFSVTSKYYTFSLSTQVHSIFEETMNIDFTANK